MDYSKLAVQLVQITMDLFHIAVVLMMKYSMEKAAKNAPSTAMAHFHIANAQETMFTMKKRMNA